MKLKDIIPGKLGFGTAPLGNMFRDIPEAEARAMVDAAWNDGIRYFDNAPFYGAGLAEIRMGEALAGRPRQLAAAVRSEVRALDRDVAVAAIRPMDEAFGDSLAQRRFQTGLLEVFGAAALLLALAGIYSVTAFSVVERTREIGVRISLGSGRGRILGLVFRQAMLPVGIGILFGAAAALGLGRLVAGLLFGVRANDPATLGVSAVLVGLAALLASAIPALRATRIDPVRALRAE